MLLQDLIPESLQRAFHGGDLGENVPAVAVVVQHFADPAQLPDHALQPVLQQA